MSFCNRQKIRSTFTLVVTFFFFCCWIVYYHFLRFFTINHTTLSQKTKHIRRWAKQKPTMALKGGAQSGGPLHHQLRSLPSIEPHTNLKCYRGQLFLPWFTPLLPPLGTDLSKRWTSVGPLVDAFQVGLSCLGTHLQPSLFATPDHSPSALVITSETRDVTNNYPHYAYQIIHISRPLPVSFTILCESVLNWYEDKSYLKYF